MGDFNALLNTISDLVIGAAGQPWVYAVVVIGCIIDGFFPPFPSESIVVGLAALVLTPGGPNLWLLMIAAALGAFLGDNLAYVIGRRVGITRYRWMRRPVMQRAFGRVARGLDQRAVPLLLVARFIPIGRVAVNLTAGATRYSWKSFMPISALSATMWASYSLGIGAVAGVWFKENQLLGVVVSVVIAALLGLVVDRVCKLIQSRKQVNPESATATAEGSLGATDVDPVLVGAPLR
ncbi:DedA family protein [Arthrobacter sp. GMC3]|uniref:DedA family protein n=1 Tax=Arthrobacter sp. GMC3 TaxID=2058894 RepID=UPI002157C14E|nr:DedA family protein [Arthrobacter sp. GMC3]